MTILPLLISEPAARPGRRRVVSGYLGGWASAFQNSQTAAYVCRPNVYICITGIAPQKGGRVFKRSEC
jgi:hypothetical protein